MNNILLTINGKDFYNKEDINNHIASIGSIEELTSELKVFDSFMLRLMYENMSKKNDKKKLNKKQWIKAIYEINHKG